MTPNVPPASPTPPGKAVPSAKKENPYFSVKGARWLLFGAFAGVAPFIVEALYTLMFGTFRLLGILGRGDLMLVGAAIGFSAVAELIANNKSKAKGKVVASGVCTICSFIEAGVYGALKGSGHTGIEGAVALISVTLFVASLISGYVCIWLSE